MNAIRKIDLILKYFATDEAFKKGLTRAEIQNGVLRINPSFSSFPDFQADIDKILSKLQKDGYLDYREQLVSNPTFPGGGSAVGIIKQHERYIITFEGDLFFLQGGYQEQINRQNTENIRVAALEKSQKVNANRMTYLTTVLAFGTLIAAVFYLLEINNNYFHIPVSDGTISRFLLLLAGIVLGILSTIAVQECRK